METCIFIFTANEHVAIPIIQSITYYQISKKINEFYTSNKILLPIYVGNKLWTWTMPIFVDISYITGNKLW
jgi:hypothetical protein